MRTPGPLAADASLQKISGEECVSGNGDIVRNVMISGDFRK
jgi:hypothetical protein